MTGTPLDPDARTWSGSWVRGRLGVDVHTSASPVGVDVADLVGLAVRRNPRRAHLLVSTVLGKHVPTDPRLVLGSGLLLGRLVGDLLAGRAVEDVDGGRLLRAALGGDPASAAGLVRHARSTAPRAPQGTVVLGFAETATALGHAVAEALGASTLHSTRRPVPGVTPAGAFEESHSHATSHLLLPDDPGLLARDAPLVLVDDELSTGATALGTIEAVHRIHPHERYVIAALVDLRGPDDAARTAALATRLGARIDVVALAAGSTALPDDVLAAGAALVAATEGAQPTTQPGKQTGTQPGTGTADVVRLAPEAPAGLREGGRHGFDLSHQRLLAAYLATVADAVAAVAAPGALHVLGTEELMYAPLLLATELADHWTSGPVTCSTTTRSPVLAVDDPGYAIRTRLAFDDHDRPADGPGPRFAYNLRGHDTVVLVVDRTGDTDDLDGAAGLVSALRGVAGRVVVLTLPEHVPGATP